MSLATTSLRLGTSAFVAALLGAVALLPHAQQPKAQSLLPFAGVAAAEGPALAMHRLKKAQSEAFVENLGQWDSQAQFLARSPGVDTWVTERGVVYDFHRFVPDKDAKKDPRDPRGKFEPPKGKRQGHVVRMEFVGGTPSAVRGEGLLEGRHNYFLGKDESRWASNVPRYGEARAERVYDGIEARWYFDQGRPRYDLIVAPGADPGKIAMRFEGAEGLRGGKTLKLGTSLGDVEHRGLFAYQKVGGTTKQVPASFVVRGNLARFELGEYDKTKPLVIDPLVYSTYLGGGARDAPQSVAVHSSGDAVVVGSTHSTDYPTTPGSYDLTHGDHADAFLTKLSADGSTLLYSTFLGGNSTDVASSVALDSSGAAVVAGDTLSSDFPTTAGAFDTSKSGGTDAFVTKLSADGSSLIYSTFLGGNSTDGADAVALDSSGAATVVGYTVSETFPTTGGAFDQSFNSAAGIMDAFVSKLSADGSFLLYSTFLGGAGLDRGYSVALDSSGGAVVVGLTTSTDFPTTEGSYERTPRGGTEAFVTRLSPNGSALVYSTFLGGTSVDTAFSVALDSSGNALVTGYTTSVNFPTTEGSYDRIPNGEEDSFVTKLSSDGSALVYSTYLGGLGDERAQSVALDSSGNAVVAGYTQSTNFPTTVGSFDPSFNGGGYDAFVSRLSADGSSLLYSTDLGGGSGEFAKSVALDSSGGAAVVGYTNSTDFPTTPGSYRQNRIGLDDGFVTKLRVSPVVLGVSVPRNSFVGGFSVPLTIDMTVAQGVDYAVALSTDTPGKVFVSQTKIKAGKVSKTFGVRTEMVKVDTPVMITASFGGVSKSVSFTLKPGGLMSLKLKPTTISSLELGTGTVALSSPAPVDGRRIELDSSNNAVLYVPVAVDIEHGQTEAVFPTFAGFVASTSTVTVKARLGTTVKTATLTVNP